MRLPKSPISSRFVLSISLGILGLIAMSTSGCSTLKDVAAAPALSSKAAPRNVNGSAGFSSFVVLGEAGVASARVITFASTCPRITIDGVTSEMALRAPAQTLPLRPTRSSPEESKPSEFPVTTCEKILPAGAISALVDGLALPLPKSNPSRIVVIGDTGCRLKKSDSAYQPCNDPARYPFATIAATAAAWKPDLVIHVGDYHYRENPCPEANVGCKDSPWGYGWNAWQADFFAPGKPLLQAAPWVTVRGNHESCARAGQGWWRMIDPRPLIAGRDCIDAANDNNGDFSAAYAVPLGNGAQLIVLDTSNTLGGVIPAGDIREIKYRELYQQMEALSQQADYNIAINHHPILGFAATHDKEGNVKLLPGNQGMQSVFRKINPLMFPPKINALLSGHVHVWQEVSFATPHPTQFVAGFSGTMEDTVPLPAILPEGATPAMDAIVAHLSSWVNGFGYMTMERDGASHWHVKVWNTKGQQVNACQINGSKSVCEVGQVQ